MQIIQRGFDERDSRHLIYNTDIFLGLDLSFWILKTKTLCKPSSNFSFQMYKSYQKIDYFNITQD